MDGTDDVAPPLNDIAGKERLLILPDGAKRTLKADDKYLRASIMDPGAEVVDGFDDEMPPYSDELSEEDLGAIVNFLLGKDEGGKDLSKAEHPGRQMAEVEGCLKCHSTDGTTTGRAPTWKGLYGSEVKVYRFSKKETVIADEAYLRQSIR